jgi:hypothetical protein
LMAAYNGAYSAASGGRRTFVLAAGSLAVFVDPE